MNRIKLIMSVTLAVLILVGCDPSGTRVTMRDFSSANVMSSLASSIRSAVFVRSTTTEGVTTDSEVADALNSSIYCEGDSCTCEEEKVELSQIFLKESSSEGGHTFLYRNDEVTGDNHTFAEENVIGIDISYDGGYVRMSDIYIFDQDSSGEYAYVDGVAEEVFKDTAADTWAVSFDFPIGSSEDTPDVSTTGCWMRIVLDFEA
jgi:hypothetical protein